MNPRRRKHTLVGMPASDLIDEATHLLRLAPAPVLAAYFVGTLPFLAVLLYFVGDMAHSAFAYEHCGSGALGVAAAFFWMKTWQAVFASGLKAHIQGHPAETVTFRRWGAILLAQAGLQAWGLVALPLAVVAVIPLGWVLAFFQNGTALGANTDATTLRRESARLAVVWQRQNWAVIGILAGFAFFVFLDVVVTGMQLPRLIKTLSGIETAATLSPWAMWNTTFVAACVALTYLFVDPVVKAVYVLRCHYGAAIHNGDDLLTDLRALKTAAARALALLALVLLPVIQATAAPASAQPPAMPPAVNDSVAPRELNRAIDETLSQREYAWRTPRKGAAEQAPGMFDSLFRAIDRTVEGMKDWFMKIAGRIVDWLNKLNRKPDATGNPTDRSGLIFWLQVIAYLLVVGLIAVAAVIGWRYFRNRRRREVIASEPVAPVPDLEDENVVASQLPEDGWLKLAREMMDKGELRLALRAFYLATLAHLAGRELISVARFKTNLDYERELRRRARSKTELQTAFAQSVSQFDRAWYGLHEVSRERLDHFAANFERIRTC